MAEGYKDAYVIPGLKLNGDVPTTANDVTDKFPVPGEIRCDETNLYIATAVSGTSTVTWKKLAWAAFA